jgi:endoglucanase
MQSEIAKESKIKIMKYILTITLLLLPIFLLNSCRSATTVANSSTFQTISPKQMVKRMGKGINLGNTLEAPTEGQWAEATKAFYFDDFKKMGFQNVRIPTHWGKYTDEFSPYSINEKWLNRVEEVVDWALERGFIVILNAHHEKWLLEECSEANLQRFEAIWTQIAARFKDKSENLVFEIINEPYFELSPTQVDVINFRILPIIRATNPTRNVLITGGGKNATDAPQQMRIPEDDYLIAYFHYYKPFKFTNKNGDESWGTDKDKAIVKQHFDEVKAWAFDKNIPLYLGEFACSNRPKRSERLAYYQYISELATERNIPFSVWENSMKGKADMGFYDRKKRTWDEEIVKVLMN